tara:strand:- start:697 stop:891 length:195 start_codon:yes stop_codon:yes gene_type:complete
VAGFIIWGSKGYIATFTFIIHINYSEILFLSIFLLKLSKKFPKVSKKFPKVSKKLLKVRESERK